ncbi:MAG: aldo/keto reductase [Candidatus Nanohaloarchaeota archaeon QJJ-5]|nr:aldo/keto reductase [Candidatus Nanohaloarchaeota archaeon QJJ-5]
MELKTVNDTAVPSIGLGTWQMKGSECEQAVTQALEMGYRHVDTARIYDNEKMVGNGIQNAAIDRDDVFLTTKIWRTELEADEVRPAMEESLERLQTDHVDLVLIHWPNMGVPLDETLHAFQELQDDGLARNIGVSNFTERLLDRALEIAPSIITNQVETHPFHQQHEMASFCQDNDLLLTAYSPLARGQAVENDVITDIADKHGKEPAQVVLRWLTQRDNVVAIPKAAPKQYQRQNLNSIEFSLDADDMDKIGDLDRDEKLVDPGFAPW